MKIDVKKVTWMRDIHLSGLVGEQVEEGRIIENLPSCNPDIPPLIASDMLHFNRTSERKLIREDENGFLYFHIPVYEYVHSIFVETPTGDLVGGIHNDIPYVFPEYRGLNFGINLYIAVFENREYQFLSYADSYTIAGSRYFFGLLCVK